MMISQTQPASPACADGRPTPEQLAKANINPSTGLATDYLNHFNEAIMLLDLVSTVPECLPDLMAWGPMSYQDHFAGSGFKDKELAVLSLHPGWVKTDMGGADAPTEVTASAAGLISVIDRVTFEDSGAFLNFLGERVAW